MSTARSRVRSTRRCKHGQPPSVDPTPPALKQWYHNIHGLVKYMVGIGVNLQETETQSNETEIASVTEENFSRFYITVGTLNWRDCPTIARAGLHREALRKAVPLVLR